MSGFSVSRLATAFAGTAVTLLVLDAFWLTLAAGALYKPNLPGLLLDGFRLVPAALFYLLYIGGILWFAVLPALEQGALAKAALNGALLGLVAYGTYDLTNHATLKTWSTTVTVADMIWGSFLTATAATAGTYVALRWG